MKPASPSPRLLLPADDVTNKSSTEARVVQRCLGAPSPWMPAPFRFRKIISAFHRREARKGAEAAAARKAAREAQRIPKGVTYYKVPKGQADRPEQWVAEQNAKIRNDRLVEAHGGGKAVVRGGKLVHLPDEHGPRQSSKHGRFLLSGAQSERSARLTDIPSFCAKKSTEAWKECVVEHAKSRCTAEAANEAPLRRFYTNELAACLADTQHCESTLSHLQHLTSNLRGVGALALSRPSCLLYNAGVEQDEKEAAACGALGDNSETAGYIGRCGKPGGGPAEGCSVNVADIPLPPRDIRKRWGTCAVVGHAAGLLAAKNGASIDAHDAVFRVNPDSAELAAQATKVGRRTTVAVLGREGTDALVEGEGGFSRAHAAKTPYIVFWHYHAAQYLRHLTEEIPVQGRTGNTTTLALMSPALINWQLEVYAKLRADLIRLGLGPLSCPRFMSSGMHAMLLATQLCRNVNLFGISVESGSAPKQGARSSSINRHSFDAETMITRLLWMAGAFDVCTA